jgi:hypothetical protein
MNVNVLATVAGLGDIPNELVENCFEPSRREKERDEV